LVGTPVHARVHACAAACFTRAVPAHDPSPPWRHAHRARPAAGARARRRARHARERARRTDRARPRGARALTAEGRQRGARGSRARGRAPTKISSKINIFSPLYLPSHPHTPKSKKNHPKFSPPPFLTTNKSNRLDERASDESRRSIVPSIHTMQDAHLVQHTVSFEDRPWLNDMDKKTPIEVAAEARRAASNNQARSPTHPVPVQRLVPTDHRRLQMPSSGTTAHPDAAFRKKRSRRTAPSTATIATTPTRTNIMHASLSKGVGPFEHRPATRVLPVWWR
jgi:hypothetical protein